MSTSETFLIAMAIIFTVPYGFWRLLRTEKYAPLVVVQIVSGILLGPGVLGKALPGYYQFVFPAPVIALLNGIAMWAVMGFVWVAGIELDLHKVWRYRRESGVTAGAALSVPLLFGAGAALLIIRMPGWIGPRAQDWQFVLGIGMACAVTALPILVLLMEKMAILRFPLGQRILRYASLDDIAIWGVLALILLDWERVGRQVGFLVGYAVAALLFRRLMRLLSQEDRWYAGVIWLILCGFAADWCGLHYMVGAFLSGVVIEESWLDRAKLDMLRNNLLLYLMPVFFLSTGLRTHWDVGGVQVFALAALLLVASIGGKLLGLRLAGKWLGWQKGEASLIGWLLQTKALIMIIFVNVLLDRSIITADCFTGLLLMAVVSTMLTMPITARKLKALPDILHRDH